jgi:hypothetical protein
VVPQNSHSECENQPIDNMAREETKVEAIGEEVDLVFCHNYSILQLYFAKAPLEMLQGEV